MPADLGSACIRDLLRQVAELRKTEGVLRTALGCYTAQGFYLSRPIPAADVLTLQRRWEGSGAGT